MKKKETKTRKKRKQKKKLKKSIAQNWIIILFITIVIALGAGMFLIYKEYTKTKEEIEALKDPSRYAQLMEEEDQRVIEKLSLIMLLPDETYEIHEIFDAEAAREQLGEFFKDAQNGDKLIVYTSKAILYRADSNLIVNVGPVISTPEETTSESSPETEEEN